MSSCNHELTRLRSELANLENSYSLLRREKEDNQKEVIELQQRFRSTLDETALRETKVSTMEREINML